MARYGSCWTMTRAKRCVKETTSAFSTQPGRRCAHGSEHTSALRSQLRSPPKDARVHSLSDLAGRQRGTSLKSFQVWAHRRKTDSNHYPVIADSGHPLICTVAYG